MNDGKTASTDWRGNLPALGAMVVLFVLMNIFWDTPVLYAVKVFTVLMHELSHGLAAILTGGGMVRIEISPDIGGLCYTYGGSRIAVVTAGYLGSMLFGCAIMLIAARTRFDKALAMFIGIALIVLVIVAIRTLFGIVFGLLFGAGMILMARYASHAINEFVLLLLGSTSALYAIIDIKEDLIARSIPCSDAHAMSRIIPLPSIVWGVLWGALAVYVVFHTLKIALRDDELNAESETDLLDP